MNSRATKKCCRTAKVAVSLPRGTAMAVAASVTVVILSTVLFPQMAVDGAAVDGNQLFEPKLIAHNFDQGHMLDSELDPYLGQLHDVALDLKVIKQIRIRLFIGKGRPYRVRLQD